MNARVIRRTILTELAAGHPHPTVQATLLEGVQSRIRDFSLADLVEHLGWLRDSALVDMMPDPLSPDDRSLRRWFITESGIVSLRS